MNLLKQMLNDLPFTSGETLTLIATAPFRYKVYRIPKKQKGKYRTIAQPTPEIKLIQRWLINNVFCDLPVHNCATAYRQGKNIATHAKRHAGNRFLLKMDFENFFPSILAADVETYLRQLNRFSTDEVAAICRLVCWQNKQRGSLGLSIGAPSSPILSNAMLHEFDTEINAFCRENGVRYSRYADDLAFSTNKENVLADIPSLVDLLCTSLASPKLKINHEKTVSTSRAHRRTLVGLILSSEGKVSLGRERKRRLRNELYRYSIGKFPQDEVASLRGELAFAWSVEPNFIRALLGQVGVAVFKNLELPFRAD
jgi:RNA-directed DNA polymerase